MVIDKKGKDISITIDSELTAKEFSSGKNGFYERQDVKIGDVIYTAQIQIYEKADKKKK